MFDYIILMPAHEHMAESSWVVTDLTLQAEKLVVDSGADL